MQASTEIPKNFSFAVPSLPFDFQLDLDDDFGVDMLERLSFSNDGGLLAFDDPLAVLPPQVSVQEDDVKMSLAPVIHMPPPFPIQILAAENIALEALPANVRKDVAERNNSFRVQFKIPALKKKYYRTDSKALQCFPYCERFVDYREARLLGNEHGDSKQRGNICTPLMVASLHLPPDVSPACVHVRGRFLQVTPVAKPMPDGEPIAEVGDILSCLPERQCYRGSLQHLKVDEQGWNEFKVSLGPPEGHWVMQLELTRHRRNAAEQPDRVPLFLFEIMVFVQVSPSQFRVASRSLSTLFEVASCRTLLREVLAYRDAADGGQNPQVGKKSKTFMVPSSSSQPSTKHQRLTRAPVYASTRQTLAPVALEIKPRGGLYGWFPMWSSKNQ